MIFKRILAAFTSHSTHSNDLFGRETEEVIVGVNDPIARLFQRDMAALDTPDMRADRVRRRASERAKRKKRLEAIRFFTRGLNALAEAQVKAMEEANATLERVTAFGLSSNPSLERHTYPNGDQLQNVSLLAHGFLANKDFAPDGGEVSEIRFLHPSEIDRDRFVATEYPTFSHWQAFKVSGIFQIV